MANDSQNQKLIEPTRVKATRITMMEVPSSLHPTGLPTVPTPTFITSAARTMPSLALPTGKNIATFDCPFVDKSKQDAKSSARDSSQRCQLQAVPEQRALIQEGLVAVSMHNIEGCLVARGQYKQNKAVIFHCAVSCEEKAGRNTKGAVTDGMFDCT